MKTFKFVILVGLAGISGATAFAQGDTLLPIKTANYSIPVQAELAAQAKFEVAAKDVEVSQVGDSFSVRYRLPAELVGPGTESIQFSQASHELGQPFRNMVGKQKDAEGNFTNVAFASCGKTTNQKKFMCLIVYHSLQVDSEKAEEFLNSKYHGAADLPSRLKVAALFSNEPSGGVLLIELE